MNVAFIAIVKRLHKISFLRKIARYAMRGISIKQSYHGGVIYCDAVEHSWAWSGNTSYEKHDRSLQDVLLGLSETVDVLIDTGSNVGAISLSVALRNEKIEVVAIDPNVRATRLLEKSVKKNRLERRFEVIRAAVGDASGHLVYDRAGSVTGHISDSGSKVRCVKFSDFLVEKTRDRQSLVKIDVEGYETVLLRQLDAIPDKRRLCFVVEVHPSEFNGYGDPDIVHALLVESGAAVSFLDGSSVTKLPRYEVSQIVARWL